ncbi:NAC domain-containing protein 83-like [Andrographis paniculata]|uniref:NAC domain-containing protein 83-like n=1 Tax=Andrographis paniculata TaxID=175694 RepID=UPI0021E72DD7|nr:NAC domain-containing protein 83-like [Andrographis paniculata]XP_051116456.1 NAC domain-containing protein 83-like [Andrographis paniculata]XP_051116464.1 NAC domain-containing protein 83-like [Andrographis paniculata]
MDKWNFVKDGGSKLPLGFRFQPTDEEIVFQYLARKIFCHPLPALVIPEINVFSFDPWELPGDLDQDKYFFNNQESNHRHGIRTGRATCSGYWKATGSAKRIVSSKGAPIVGIRNSLVFYKAKHPRPVRTDWIMHEYCIALSGNTDCNIQQRRNSQGSLIRIGNWTLCHIILRKRSCTSEVNQEYDHTNSYGYTAGEVSDTDSSSASSSSPYFDSTALTEVTSSSANCDESSSQNSA